MDEFAKRLRSARKAAGLTQPKLAALCGLGQGMISDLERGRRYATTKTTEIALALNVSPAWLATGKEAPEQHSTQDPVATHQIESKPEVLTLFEQLTPKQQTNILTQMQEMAADNAAAVEVHKRLAEPHYALAGPGIIPGGAPKARTPKTHKRTA